jgi:hypothetical protein
MKDCKNCTHAGKDCFPYLATLPPNELIAWCKIRKDALRLSSGEIADRSGVPKGTVDRMFSADMSDCRLSTILPILCVLSGCRRDELTCTHDTQDEMTMKEKNAHLSDTMARLEAENRNNQETIARIRETVSDMKALARRRMRIISVLAFSLAASLLVIIAALVIDKMNSDVGFIWIHRLFR